MPGPTEPPRALAGRRPRKPHDDAATGPGSRRAWYRVVQWFVSHAPRPPSTASARRGRGNIPRRGRGAARLEPPEPPRRLRPGHPPRPRRSTTWRGRPCSCPLGPFIRSLGGFPIQRDGIGASGLKETLRRLRTAGSSPSSPRGRGRLDGDLGELKSGIAAARDRGRRSPIVPAAVAGTFEAWPRSRALPGPHPIRVHFGPPIPAEHARSLDPEALTALIRVKILECQAIAREGHRPRPASRGVVGRDPTQYRESSDNLRSDRPFPPPLSPWERAGVRGVASTSGIRRRGDFGFPGSCDAPHPRPLSQQERGDGKSRPLRGLSPSRKQGSSHAQASDQRR